MMLRERFNETLKDAMRAKDARTVSTMRLILAALKDRDIAARPAGNTGGIDEAAILSLLQGMIKQRQESAALYEKGGRPDLVTQEQDEIAVIEKFLPRQMSDSEIDAAIAEAVSATGAQGVKDMGKVMAALREHHAGKMDFGKASALVKKRLVGA